MKLTAAELAYVRSQGLHITAKCDGCGKLLNQTLRYTIAGKPEVCCSAVCRDLVFFGDKREATMHSAPGKCVHCGAILEGKRCRALYCDEVCKKRAARTGRAQSMVEPQISATPTQSSQQIAYAKNLQQGDRTSGGPLPSETPVAPLPTNSGRRSKWNGELPGAQEERDLDCPGFPYLQPVSAQPWTRNDNGSQHSRNKLKWTYVEQAVNRSPHPGGSDECCHQ